MQSISLYKLNLVKYNLVLWIFFQTLEQFWFHNLDLNATDENFYFETGV